MTQRFKKQVGNLALLRRFSSIIVFNLTANSQLCSCAVPVDAFSVRH